MDTRDIQRLRQLASHQAELAASQKNLERVALWKRHNMCHGERPVIHIEVDTFAHQAIALLLQCADPFARELEWRLLHNCMGLEVFDDDRVVAPWFQLPYDIHFQLFGHKIRETVLRQEDGTELGHLFEHIITDLEEDFHKILQPSLFGVDKERSLKKQEQIQDIFGDLLPVKLVTNGLYAVPTQKVVHMMGVENMLFAIYDYPELFLRMMDRIAESYIQFFRHLEAEGVLLQNHSFEAVAQGSMAFFEEPKISGPVKTTDLWGFLDSQETVGMSPQMFRAFIFPCYEKIARHFGRLSYGCCEPVCAFWEDIKTLPNLKKVSVSPWCDEDYMADQLRGTGIIYHRKPSPNFLGLGTTLDEEAFRAHIDKTLLTARGCQLEITQRDVYTINNDISKVQRYVRIIRERIHELW